MDVIELASKTLTDIFGTDRDGFDLNDPMQRMVVKYAEDYADARLEVQAIARRISKEFQLVADADIEITPSQPSDLHQRYMQERTRLDGLARTLRSFAGIYNQK
ncbi:hypothetical protein FB384_004900 [Prauserella sediminis]|uniref:Uncharacterized protein n=1 Tax=Prauserella sediminis TaxID=577680 RepID=A0A839XTB3_9PSEU|nr:hypothetical protein [Prauserella sediminis]MBB3665941.1 hypothetical protein [Prauserella sediminis]